MFQWLQSEQQASIFTEFFAFVDPSYLRGLSALVALSVAATIASTFESRVSERLQWLESCFSSLDPKVSLVLVLVLVLA